jgi:hypothetical protein
MMQPSDDPIEIGTNKQLFVDERFIASRRSVELVMNSPVKTNRPVMTGTVLPAAGHGPASGPGWMSSVLQEDGLIRIWGSGERILPVRSSPGGPVEHLLPYAESRDGICFTAPDPARGTFDRTGADIGRHGRLGGPSVWIDPEAPALHRYKTQTKYYPSGPGPGRLAIHSSPDGYRWTFFGFAESVDEMDTQTIVFRDEPSSKYLMYTRKNPFAHTPGRYRVVRRFESDDLLHWDRETIVLEADEIDRGLTAPVTPQPPVDYYGASVFRYPDGSAQSPFIMLAQAYWHWARRPPEQRAGGYPDHTFDREVLAPATIDVRLLVSRDGVHFERCGGRKPFLGVGPEGSFASRFAWALPNPVRVGDELWIYYYGQNRDHDGFVDEAAGGYLDGIDRAVLRLDGFVSADAEYEGGELVTPPLVFRGDRLELNFDGGAGGSVRVEFTDFEGRPIEGFSGDSSRDLFGNSVRLPVVWGESKSRSVGVLAGRPVRIRFRMRDCKLYAFQFME